MDEADVVVVGAGPGGIAASARLAADPATRVWLIEAGDAGGWRAAAPGYRPRPPEPIVWPWATEPQPALGGRRLFHPTGRALGGSGAIGWGIHWPGEPEAFDALAAAGLTGWSWADVRSCYPRVDANIPRPDEATRAFLEAARAGGEPLLRDPATPDARGAAPFALTIRGGERRDPALDGLQRRRNVRILPAALAERVLFESGRTWGVRYRRGGESHVVRAAAVLLAAGAVGTPALLLRSGIGPTRELLELGIPVVARSPAVGEGLAEGVALPIAFTAAGGPFATGTAGIAARAAWLWRRRGPYAAAPVTAGLLLRAGASGSGLTAAILFSPRSERGGPGFTLRVAVPNPFARGRVRLGGADPAAMPRIDPAWLGDPRDLATLEWAREATLRLVAAEPLARFAPRHREGDADPARCEGLHQPCGTAALGAVCDERLAVRGVEGLRIADLSALPTPPLFGAATAAMIGARCAGFLIGR